MPNGPQPRVLNAPPFDPNAQADTQNYFARNHTNRRLPSAVELASRLEEARTSAKLLVQVVTNTPASEVLDNELIKEFADRCQSASRSIQAYMIADDPAPDNDTMESLIDTNEQLQSALNQHQRTVLGARKQLGIGSRSENATPSPAPEDVNGHPRQQNWPTSDPMATSAGLSPPPVPSRTGNGKGKAAELYAPSGPSGSNKSLPEAPGEDPFRDPQPEGSSSKAGSSSALDLSEPPRLGVEPYHPGFNPTPSYLGRQESAVGKVTMHGASGSLDQQEQASGQTLTPPRPQLKKDDEGDDDDDLYDSTPKRKEPMYRY